MKLFWVTYMDECDVSNYLTIGETEEEVEKREKAKLEQELSCFMFFDIHEVKEVENYKIQLIK